MEIGAGNGQWARALTDRYKEELPNTSNNKAFEYVLAYDDMSELPLSPEIYHEHTQPAHDYFYSRVQKCDSVQAVLSKWPCRGRILLLVYPPPGSMAIETVKTFAELGPENDTVVFVGEGRGGANANNELFDYFESGDWAILQVLPVKPQPGGKGYEKLYILQRIHSDEVRKFSYMYFKAWLCFTVLELIHVLASSLPRENNQMNSVASCTLDYAIFLVSHDDIHMFVI